MDAGSDRPAGGTDDGIDGGTDDEGVPAVVRRYRRLPVVIALGFAPWTVVSAAGTITVLLPFGLLNLDPVQLTSIVDYYFVYTAGLPRYLTAWGISVVLYVLAVGSALLGLVRREDGRVTAALLALAGVTHLTVSFGFTRRPGYVAVPIGTVLYALVVWRYYRTDLAAIVWPSVE